MHIYQKNTKHSTVYWITIAVVLTAFTGLIWSEIRFSTVQSKIFSDYSQNLYTNLMPGSSNEVIYPKHGPFNVQRGYTRIPEFIDNLEDRGFRIEQQSRFSPSLLMLAQNTITPPYREPMASGLKINDNWGKTIFDVRSKTRIYSSYGQIPPIIINTLLFLEDRQLGRPAAVSTNPVINWGRLYRAALLYGIGQFGVDMPREGGSTLATQLEKFRYSPNGRTESVAGKIRQMIGASIKVYSEGNDTRNARENIIVDYLNSVPLAATPSFGEVYGLGQGLYAWFGQELSHINRALSSLDADHRKISAYKQVLTLIAAIRAPSYFLQSDQEALQRRVTMLSYVLEEGGVIDSRLAKQLREAPLPLNPIGVARVPIERNIRKAVNEIRNQLAGSLGVTDYYQLNRLYLETDSTLDSSLQDQVMRIFGRLREPEFLEKNGLKSYRLLERGDPAKLQYSFLMYENTSLGNELRVHADTNSDSFDINRDMKLDLGSTAKLRTLVHYLEVVHELFEASRDLDESEFKHLLKGHLDPITRWVYSRLYQEKEMPIEKLLTEAMDRKYSANPGEVFFTGGGLHRFRNYSPRDDLKNVSLTEATVRSVNLVFIRLIRDLVKFHRARLSYDADWVLNDKSSSLRRVFLEQSAEQEGLIFLEKFYRKYRQLSPEIIVENLLSNRVDSIRHLAILYFSSHQEPTKKELSDWLNSWSADSSEASVDMLWEAYAKPYLRLPDYGYLLGKHPLEVWVAGRMIKTPEIQWSNLLELSKPVRILSSQWLFKTRNLRPQKRRLRIRIEQDAFRRMAEYWKRVGFPFDFLVPSYATAIGSSADRPAALAELMGIIVNEGIKKPNIRVKSLNFAEATPYHTVMTRSSQQGTRVLAKPIANILYGVLQGTVERGTARRARGAFTAMNGNRVALGGKTGSGDNRIDRVDKRGNTISSHAVNRTATFSFFIGKRFFGVVTAFVSGSQAEQYGFTSSLPVAILRLLSPAISERL